MDGIRNPVKQGMLVLLFLFGLTWSGPQEVHAALLDGLLDGVEESLAEGLTEKGEHLTTGNFYTDDKPNAHAPIGMMGDHTHEPGEFMFSYRVMHMFMEGTRYGTNRLTNAEVTMPGRPVPSGYLIAPESMRMWMQMFGFMYGLNDTVTLMAGVPYLTIGMNHIMRNQRKFRVRSEGFGDIRLGSLWQLWAVEAPSIGAHRFHFNLSLSVPTGSIEPTDRTPLGNIRLPYPMHRGSGTFDFYPGITYGGEMGHASWGIQTIGTLRAGRNSNDFSMGDGYVINAHSGYEVIKNTLSSSVRLSWKHWDAYDGMDTAIRTNHPMNQMRLAQTAFSSLLGGQRLEIHFGINVLFPTFMSLENRLAVEGGLPIYQYLDGQLETDSIVMFGWQAVH